MSDAPHDAARDALAVRVVQTAPILGNTESNLRRLNEAVSDAVGRDIVLAPELATHGYDIGSLPTVTGLLADDPRLALLGGHGPTTVVGFAESDGGALFNSAAVAGPGGLATQRKLTLPTYDRWEEKKHFRPGTSLSVFRHQGTTFGVLICNDAWQPQLAWILAHRGIEVILVPADSVVSTVGLPVRDAWYAQLRALAVAFQCYVVFANRVGEEPCGRFWGGSTAFSPAGDSLGQLDDEPGLLDVDLDIAALRQLRRRWPFQQDSCAEVVLEASRQIVEGELRGV